MFFRKKIQPEALNDEDLILEFRKTGSSELLGHLFSRYSHLVFGVCMKYLKNTEEARDTVMQVFEKLQTELKKHEITHFKSWLYMVAKNHCLMQLRKNSHVHEPVENHIETIFMESDEELHLLDTETKLQDLEENLHKLSHEQKTCIELFFLRDKSYKEVAELTGFTLMQVKSHIQNGKRNLKNLMLEKNGQGNK